MEGFFATCEVTTDYLGLLIAFWLSLWINSCNLMLIGRWVILKHVQVGAGMLD
jgi:hypothetical protein